MPAMPAAKRTVPYLLFGAIGAIGLGACQPQPQEARAREGVLEGSATVVAGPPVAVQDDRLRRQADRSRRDRPADEPHASQATVQGVVQELQLSEGKLILTTDEGPMTIHALPSDIAHVHAGDAVHLAYRVYEGERWLLPQQDLKQAAVRYGTNVTMAGNISSVDKRRGIVSIGTRTVRAHPEQIESIIPGQFMTLYYAQVGDEDWLTKVTPHMPKDDETEDMDEQEVMGD